MGSNRPADGHRLRAATPTSLPTVTNLPALDTLAADPALATELPAPAVIGLLARLATAQSALAARALTLTLEPPAAPPADADRLLTVEEAAQQLAVSTDWVYRRAAKLPFTVRLDGALRFSARGLARYLRRRQGLG